MNLLKLISLTGIAIGCILIFSCEEQEISDKSLDQFLDELNEGQINDDTFSTNEATSANASSVSDTKAQDLLERDQKNISDQILILINEYRASKNLTALTNNNTAKIEALNHSEYQANRNNINHDNGNERSNILFKNENATSYAENVAFDFRTAKAVVDAWIDSEGHRKNLEGDFTNSGIGTIANDEGVLYFTHILFK
ncbi:CAP domain-containing protein [Aquimarina agarivorans]|uniref:CAP domain-containing protein n=1 Tax=Aquimarina agarivorans TaxID=980584 RepID=UPI000248F58C|nr:CAP domain-containing protein [Aquimarina agarivorans]